MKFRLPSARRPILSSATFYSAFAASFAGIAFAGFVASASAQTAETRVAVLELEKFEVSERGVSRANNVLQVADVSITAEAGTTPLLLLNRLPGVNVNTSNTFGIRTSDGSSLRLRAFSLSALAVSVDGVPTNYNGALATASNPNRFIDGENLSNIVVAPGTGDVSTPAYAALGGSINFFTRGPEKAGGRTDQRDLW